MPRLALLAFGVAAAVLAPAYPAGGPPSACAAPAPELGSLTRVILQTADPGAAEPLVTAAGGRAVRRLPRLGALVAEVPDPAVTCLAGLPGVESVSRDRPLVAATDLTTSAIGARWVRENLGFDGAGVGVGIIDSGVMAAHEDLASNRVVHFMDFAGFLPQPYDGYGHGTHVAGIIAGNGAASGGRRQGVAPGAHLVVLKALDAQGHGFISTAIAALDYAIEQRTRYNIRIINLSVAAGVYESYKTDPLTLAARRAVDAGIVVVTAAGNLGEAGGRAQFGGITAPGNAPWVLTVGATSHNGTEDPGDDTVAPFSSRGPTAIDMVAKPDLVAPGVGIESLADPGSTLFASRLSARLAGTAADSPEPYLSLSGTSMAAPVVAGTVALLLQANPGLTPPAVKALLQASADSSPAYTQMAQGAGFLNARAAVDLALAFAQSPTATDLLAAASAAAADDSETVSHLAASPSFASLAGALAGLSAPAAGTVVWRTPAAQAWSGKASGVR